MTLEQLEEKLKGREPGLMDASGQYAVLVPLVEREGKLHILYEVRSQDMRRQPGEVCFPGGRIEGDETPEACAIRETEEELGIPTASITVLGRLDFVAHRANFIMYPVLARVETAAAERMALNPAGGRSHLSGAAGAHRAQSAAGVQLRPEAPPAGGLPLSADRHPTGISVAAGEGDGARLSVAGPRHLGADRADHTASGGPAGRRDGMSGAEHLGPYLLGVKEGSFPWGRQPGPGGLRYSEAGLAGVRPGDGERLSAPDAGGPGGGSLTGVEREERAAQCARENLAHSGLEGTVLQADWRQVTLPAGGFDLVISNPPYFQPGHGGDGGGARQADCSLEELCRTAARLLRNRGRFALCHRPERLADLMCALRGAAWSPNGCGCWPMGRSIPSCVLMEAVRRGRPGLRIEP